MSSSSICAPCSDSPLSITGNVISTVTFVYVLVVGVCWRANIMRNARHELAGLLEEYDSRKERMMALSEKLDDLETRKTNSKLQTARTAVRYAEAEAQAFEWIRSRDDIRSLRGILGWVSNRDSYKGGMERMQIWTQISREIMDEADDDSVNNRNTLESLKTSSMMIHDLLRALESKLESITAGES
ncbi:unnamed protein product [Periconia digitata]|uniref:Uncharacterized protein n=1 Tax=Periconia digitata TaxID=1303443 RepID=A0A9W4UJS5_9PLEO|nr:unnamed protein product [Periconia digitata]